MTPALLTVACLAAGPPAESGSGLFAPPDFPADVVAEGIGGRPESGSDLATGGGTESGSGWATEAVEDLNRAFRRRLAPRDGFLEGLYVPPESGSGIDRTLEIGPSRGRVGAIRNGSERTSSIPAPRAPPVRNELEVDIPAPITLPPPGTGAAAELRSLLVGFGWIAAALAGAAAGYLLGVRREDERRRRNLEPRQLDLAGEVAEVADSLLAAADSSEADRFAACIERLRERIGRTAVLLDDPTADAVRNLVRTAESRSSGSGDGAPRTDVRAAYDRLVATLRRSVRGGR